MYNRYKNKYVYYLNKYSQLKSLLEGREESIYDATESDFYSSPNSNPNISIFDRNKRVGNYSDSSYTTTPYKDGVEREEEFIEDTLVDIERQPRRMWYLDTEDEETDFQELYTTSRVPSIEQDNEPVDVGIKGLARAEIKPKFRVQEDEFINLADGPDKGKILEIKDLDSFDEFTEKYGFLESEDIDSDKELILIKWDLVAENYRGFYLHPGLNSERYEDVVYKGEIYPSWWKNEFNYDGVLIFVKSEIETYEGKEISKPFSGKVFSYNDFTEDSYTDINTETNTEKILVLDSIKSFDKFSNNYGLVKSGNKLGILWRKVAEDYKGFYIDPNSPITEARIKRGFYNGKKIKSWLKSEGIKPGSVYIFDL